MFAARSHFSRELNELAAALRTAPPPSYDLTETNPTRAELRYPAEAIQTALCEAARLRYDPQARGLPAARQAIAEWYATHDVHVDPNGLVLTCSTSEAYAYCFKLLCNPGDEVLVPRPSYPLLQHLAALEGVRLRPYPIDYDGAWHIDVETLRRQRTPRTRAIVVIHPNNPTGSYLKQAELTAMTELGLPIVSDEVFSRYALRDDASRITSALQAAPRAPVIAFNGLSKHGLPQAKLAWACVAGPGSWTEEALARLELIADTFLSVATAVQLALPRLLPLLRSVEGQIGERLQRNHSTLQQVLRPSTASVLHLEGGWAAVLKLPATHSELQWVLALLHHDSVLVQPGWFYDFAEEPYAVVSLLTPERLFAPGVERLAARLHSGPPSL